MKKEQEKTNVKLVVVTLLIFCIIAPIMVQIMLVGAVKLLEWGILRMHPELATEYAAYAEEEYEEEAYAEEVYAEEEYEEEAYAEEEYEEEAYAEEAYEEEAYAEEEYEEEAYAEEAYEEESP